MILDVLKHEDPCGSATAKEKTSGARHRKKERKKRERASIGDKLGYEEDLSYGREAARKQRKGTGKKRGRR